MTTVSARTGGGAVKTQMPLFDAGLDSGAAVVVAFNTSDYLLSNRRAYHYYQRGDTNRDTFQRKALYWI